MSIINNRGSIWRRWDLHLHSTASDGKATPAELVNMAMENDIAVIALTDHHTVDGIDEAKKVGHEKGITVISGIEFRTEYGQKSVHMIGLFPDSYNGINLDAAALSELVLSKLDLSKTAIKAKGRELDPTFDDNKAYKEGLLRCQVSFKEAADLIHQYGGLVSVHAGSKSNSMDEEMRHEGKGVRNVALIDSLGVVKEELLRNYIDICEVRKDKEVDFYLKYFNKPCIAASDTHNKDEFARNFAWIKAEPSFEGLRQILYEPECRVRIQTEKPESKRDYLVIDSLHLGHPDFSSQQIPLNDGLNTIIGGRSSGKSILLGCIARLCGDKTPIKKDKPEYDTYINRLLKQCTITWRDGVVGEKRKIDYFPQGYIIEIAADSEKRTSLVESLLRGDAKGEVELKNIKSFFTNQSGEIHTAFSGYIMQKQEYARLEEQLVQVGSKSGIEAEIRKIEEKISQIKESLPDRFTEEQESEYQSKKAQIEEIKLTIAHDQAAIDAISVKEITDVFDGIVLPEIDCNETAIKRIRKEFREVIDEAKLSWSQRIQQLIRELNQDIADLKIKAQNIESDPAYIYAINQYEHNKELFSETEKLKKEQDALSQITSIEQKMAALQDRMDEAFESILSMHYKFYEAALTFCKNVRLEKEGVLVEPKVTFDEIAYKAIIDTYFDGRSNKNSEVLYFRYTNKSDYEKRMRKIIKNILSEKYVIKGGYSIYKVAEDILSNNMFSISYDIHYQGDNLRLMSEGKAAFVILT